MCRSLGPKPIAVFRERSIPALLQYLHHRLLDESIQHRRNAQLAHPAVRLRDFHPFHRSWCVGSVAELFPDGWQVLFQVSSQFLDVPSVDAWTAFVSLHSSLCLLSVFPLADFFHPLLGSRTFCLALRQLRFGPSLEGPRGCTPTLLRKGQTVLVFLPLVGG